MNARRRAVDFRGWQSEVDYLAYEAERQKRIDLAIAQHKRMMREDEIRPLSLKWRLTVVFGACLLASFVVWAVFTWILDGLLRAFGR